MAVEETKLSIQLFPQHFNLKRLHKFTEPNLHVTHNMSLVARDISQSRPKFAKHVLDMVHARAMSSNIKAKLCLYSNHMLTRIAYHLLNMVDELQPPLTRQALASQRMLRRLVKESQKEKQV